MNTLIRPKEIEITARRMGGSGISETIGGYKKKLAVLLGAAVLMGACAEGYNSPELETPGVGGQGGMDVGSGGNGGDGGQAGEKPFGNSVGAGDPCGNPGPNDDFDGDTFLGAEDCNDCDPNVNPGAIEVINPDLTVTPVDEDCDGTPDNLPQPCDAQLIETDTNPISAAKAIDICQMAGTDKYGLVSARFVLPNGNDFHNNATSSNNPAAQVGIFSQFGNILPQKGNKMFVMSSGTARPPNHPQACQSPGCTMNPGVFYSNIVGFPSYAPGCLSGIGYILRDPIGLEVVIKVPTNATGISVKTRMASREWPVWLCTPYNDGAYAFQEPKPPGINNGNILLDQGNPITVNSGFFTACDPAGATGYASMCHFQYQGPNTCPVPVGICPDGNYDLIGTGFDTWPEQPKGGAGTKWLKTTSPVEQGEVRLRFYMSDLMDNALDSTLWVDGLEFETTPAIEVKTVPIPN
jgi:hypothetical protein